MEREGGAGLRVSEQETHLDAVIVKEPGGVRHLGEHEAHVVDARAVLGESCEREESVSKGSSATTGSRRRGGRTHARRVVAQETDVE